MVGYPVFFSLEGLRFAQQIAAPAVQLAKGGKVKLTAPGRQAAFRLVEIFPKIFEIQHRATPGLAMESAYFYHFLPGASTRQASNLFSQRRPLTHHSLSSSNHHRVESVSQIVSARRRALSVFRRCTAKGYHSSA